MNSPSETSSRNGTVWLIAYAVVVVAMIGWYVGGGAKALPETMDWADALVFGVIGLLGVVAIQFGAPVAWTLSIGTWGGLIALTAFVSYPLIRYLTFAAVLFAIGMYGMVVSRNAVRVLMSIELMLNAVNINMVAFARYIDPGTVKGQIFAIFILTVAAAEAAIGLAIVLAIYRNMATVDMERFNLLKW
jgi:NAD(P)H-quinone oxidoreductase subunit 4L